MKSFRTLLAALLSFVILCPSPVSAQKVIFPQEKQPGTAAVTVNGNEYAVSNDLFTAKFIKNNGKLLFNGCDELGLLPGSELFTVQLADGTVIPASEFVLGDITTETLAADENAVKGAKRFAGVQIKAQFTHANGLGIEWRAVLRDGSHYLRTEVDVTTTTDIAMYNIVPMSYTVENVEGAKAPSVVGNTRGAVILSDKIFAGLETPTAYNTAGEATDLDNFVFKAWDGATSWGWEPASNEIPAGIKNLSQYAEGTVAASRGYLVFREKGECTITLDYTKGNNRLQILGIDVLDLAGNVIASDYHFGFTGGSDSNRDYRLNIPTANAYMVRIFVTNAGNGEGFSSVGTINYSTKVTQPELVRDLTSTETPYVYPAVATEETETEQEYLQNGIVYNLAANTKQSNGSYAVRYMYVEDNALKNSTTCGSDTKYQWTLVADNDGWHVKNGTGKYLSYANKSLTVADAAYHFNFTDDVVNKVTGAYALYNPTSSGGKYMVMAAGGGGYNQNSTAVNNGSWCSDYLLYPVNEITGSKGATSVWYDTESSVVTEIPAEILALKNDAGVSITEVKSSQSGVFYIHKGELTAVLEWITGSGNQRVNTVGLELVNTNNQVVSSDYHWGRTGSSHWNNTYKLKVPSTGFYYVRYYAETNTNVLNSDVNVAYTLKAADEVQLFATIVEDEAVADAWVPNNWKTLPADEIPNRVNEVGCSDENARVIEHLVEITSAGQLSVEFKYSSGNHKLNIVGVDLLDETGNVAVDDYHAGTAGGEHNNNVYKLNVFSPGVYKIRYFADNSESINSTGNIKLLLKVDYTVHLVSPETTPIKGEWRRQTTLATDKKWSVSAVVGVVAPGQARRSFLAYSERERAVPWRAVPAYISWYEVNIDRNNAAPGREHIDNMTEEECLPILREWKTQLFDKYGVAPYAFVWDDGWDTYGEWQFHSGFPQGFTNMDEIGRSMGAGQGAWLGPVGGYGTSGGYRKNYWNSTKTGGMQLSNPLYYDVFVNAVTGLLRDKGYDFRFFKFDGISAQFSSVGPDAGATGNENAEAIIMAEQVLRGIKEDVFLNTTVGTWASPFWFQFTDAVWRQEKDYGEIGNNRNDRENWITYRDRLVYQNFVQNSPICPINTLMTHGFIFTNFSEPASTSRDWDAVVRELRCAFVCGSGMVELYNDYELTNNLVNPHTGEKGALWREIADCMAWQLKNADVLPDAHWVGGNPWTGAKAEVYGWAAWNGEKATLALRNGANEAQTYKFTLREALDIPAYIKTTVTFSKSFADQLALTGFAEGAAIDIDAELTVTLPGSSLYVFDGVDGSVVTVEPAKYYRFKDANGKYLSAAASLAVNENADASTVFYLTEDSKLLSYSNGLFLNKVGGFEAVGHTGNVAHFKKGTAENTVMIGVAGGVYVGVDWIVEEVTSLPVTVTAAKFATFYAPVTVAMPSTMEITAHTVVAETDRPTATLSEPLSAIPAETGVVLYANVDEATTFNLEITQAAPKVMSLEMKGTLAKTLVTKPEGKECYVLANGENGVALYIATNGNDNATFYNAGHKAYLEVAEKEGGASFASYSFRFGDGSTGVEEVDCDVVNDNTVYDLAGRKLERITAPGIYIVGGRRVLVK